MARGKHLKSTCAFLQKLSEKDFYFIFEFQDEKLKEFHKFLLMNHVRELPVRLIYVVSAAQAFYSLFFFAFWFN